MPSTAPLFLESETYTSKLYLINALNFGVQANVVIYDMSGALLTTKALYLEANSQQSVSIKRVLSEGGLYAQAGSLEVVTPQNESAVLGQLSITRAGTNQAYLDEELFMSEPSGSRTIRAVIDSPENSPIVAVTNTSNTVPQTIHVSCIPTSGGIVSKTLSLQSKQTRLVRACSAAVDGAFSADQIDSGFTLKPEYSQGMAGQGVAGISITTDGPPSELAAFGFVEHDDRFGRYFSAMNFADAGLLHSSSFVFSGVPVGHSKLLPAVAYTPQAAITNFSSVAQTVTVSLSSTTAGNSQTKQVAAFSVAPGSSRLVDLPGLSGDEDWQNAFLIKTSGQPGDVLSKMMFKGAGPLPNIELLPKDSLHWQNFGDHPWSIENGMRSTLFLYNHASTVRKVTVRVGSGAQVWLQVYDLQPGETRGISINRLIEEGITDLSGASVAKTATSGEVAWWAPNSGAPEVSGRVVQIDAVGATARNFSCYYSSGLCDLLLTGSPASLVDESYTTIGMTPQYCTYEAAPNGCPNDGQYTTMTTPLTYNWSSANTNIAAITSGATAQTSTWHGMSQGSTTSNLTVRVQNNAQNSCIQSGPVTVQNPTYFFSASATSVQGGCYSPSYGSFYDVSYYVADQNGNRVSMSGMTPLENAPGTNGTFKSFAAPSTTSSSGSFDDNPVGTCFSNLAPNTQYCVPSFTVTYELTSAATYSINTSTVRRDCSLGNNVQIQGNTPTAQNKTYSQGKVN